MGRYRLPASSITGAIKDVSRRISRLERVPRATNTGVASGATTYGPNAQLVYSSAATGAPNARVVPNAIVSNYPELITYYTNPTNGDDPGVLSNLAVEANGSAYYYEALLVVGDNSLQRVGGIYNPVYGVSEAFRVRGITTGQPRWVWNTNTFAQTYDYRSARTGVTRQLTLASDLATGSTAGTPYAVMQWNSTTGVPSVLSGYVYEIKLLGSASCAITASMLRFQLYENYVSTANPGTERAYWSSMNAGAVAGVRCALPGGSAYIANSSSSDYTFTNNLTLTATPVSGNAWTIFSAASQLVPTTVTIERVGRVDDPVAWPAAHYVA